VKQEWREELDRLDHRPYTTGFYAGEYLLQDVEDSRPLPAVRIVGLVREIVAGGPRLSTSGIPLTKGIGSMCCPFGRKECPTRRQSGKYGTRRGAL